MASRSFTRFSAPELHPMFNLLPLEVVGRLGVDGLGGITYYFNHFLQWEGPANEGGAGGWSLTDATGTSTIDYGNVREGTIVITADATAGADSCLQLGPTAGGKNFGYTVGKRMWCFARLQTSTIATNWKFFFGFCTPTTTPGATAPTNGIFFRNATNVADLDLVVKEGANTTAVASVTTLVAATYVVVGFFVDHTGGVTAYVNGAAAGHIAAGAAGLATLDGDATKTLQFIIDKKLASATLTLDWLLIAQEI